jgi:hypothetical protein
MAQQEQAEGLFHLMVGQTVLLSAWWHRHSACALEIYGAKLNASAASIATRQE